MYRTSEELVEVSGGGNLKKPEQDSESQDEATAQFSTFFWFNILLTTVIFIYQQAKLSYAMQFVVNCRRNLSLSSKRCHFHILLNESIFHNSCLCEVEAPHTQVS